MNPPALRVADTGSGTPGDELRIALAMRGGVSLAVWIGGASAEIDALAGQAVPFWTRLRDLMGYEAVRVDVMAGASAGGLNAAIAAAGSVYGFPLDQLRTVWLDLADISELLRPATGDRVPVDGYPSLLKGDEYFFVKLREKLEEMVKCGTPPETSPRVDVTLTATLLRPIRIQRVRGDVDTTGSRYASTFRFRHGGPFASQFGKAGADRGRTLDRLALAGRATSSFPVAFEAAAVHSSRPASFADPASEASGLAVEMRGTFGEVTAGDAPFAVMDGGVLDNIPLGRALDAIASAPAERPTRRLLVYVQPGSAGSERTEAPADAPRSTGAVLESLVGSRLQEETIAGDLDLLAERNRANAQARAVACGALAILVEQIGPPINTAPELYCLARATAEASVIARLLDDPVAHLGTDPFPRGPFVDLPPEQVDRRWRSPLRHAWDPDRAARLPDAVARALEARTAAWWIGATGGPLRRAPLVLTEACRFLDAAQDPAGGLPSGSELKAQLYRLLEVHAELVERPWMLGWVVLTAMADAEPPPELDAWVESVLDRLEQLSACDQVGGAALGAAAVRDHIRLGAPPPPGIREAILGRLDVLVGDDLATTTRPASTSRDDDLRQVLEDELRRIADELQGAAGQPGVELAIADGCRSRDLGALALRWVAAHGSAGLVDLDVATQPASQLGDVGARPVELRRLSGANPTPLAGAFRRLGGLPPDREPLATLRQRVGEPVEPLTPEAKLAGNELGNFAAFLRRGWRENDWMWGRLDAVPTLVGALVEPDRFVAAAGRARLGGAGDRDPEAAVGWLYDELHAAVRGAGPPIGEPEGDAPPSTPDDPSWPDFLDELVWAPRAAAIREVCERAVRDEPLAETDLVPVRDALVAARQWALLAELLPLDEDQASDPRRPKAVVEQANTYWVGLESVGDPAEAADLAVLRRAATALQGTLVGSSQSRLLKPVAAVGRPLVAGLAGLWLGSSWIATALRCGLPALAVACFVGALRLSPGSIATRGAVAVAAPAFLVLLAGFVCFFVAKLRAVGTTLLVGAAATLTWSSLLAGWATAAAIGLSLAVVLLVAGVVVNVVLFLRPSVR